MDKVKLRTRERIVQVALGTVPEGTLVNAGAAAGGAFPACIYHDGKWCWPLRKTNKYISASQYDPNFKYIKEGQWIR